MAQSIFIKADEVAELLGVSRAEAYRVIKRLNTTDLQMFDKLWDAAQNAGSVSLKVEALKEIMQIYKGHVLDAAYDEDWLNLTVNHYQLRYIGVTNELLKTLAEQKDYHNLHKYAAQSLSVETGNPKAYYWLIFAMAHIGATEIAKSELALAKR